MFKNNANSHCFEICTVNTVDYILSVVDENTCNKSRFFFTLCQNTVSFSAIVMGVLHILICVVRHFSLPAVTVNPPPQPPRSYSFGNHFASSTPFPCQETRPFLAYARHSTPQDTSRGQAQHGSHLASVASGVSENTRLTRQPFPVASPAQSYSMERLPHSRLPGSAGVLAHGLASPTLEPNDRQNMGNLTGSRSLSNSGSIHLHYNSHPSSCNTSQEAFQSEPPSVFMPYAEQGHFVGEVHTNSATGVQMPLEYYNNISRPHSLSFPHQVHPHWYQHASLSSIPQESENTSHLVGQVTCNPRTPHKQQYTAPYGTVNERPHSQESLFSRHPQQAQPMHYYSTPPYNRRAPVMVGPVNRGASRMRHQSVGGYPVRTDPSNQSLPKYRAAQEGGYDKHYNNIQASNKLGEPGDEVFVHPSSHHSSKEAAVNLPSTATNKLERENKCDVNPLNSKDYLRQSPCDLNKAMAHIEENLLANNSDEVVHRRRANSLHQESEYKAQKRNNRLSCVSVDERRSVHQDPDNRAQRSNNRLSFMSVDERRPNNHQSIQRSASASSNAIGSIRQIGDSRGMPKLTIVVQGTPGFPIVPHAILIC